MVLKKERILFFHSVNSDISFKLHFENIGLLVIDQVKVFDRSYICNSRPNVVAFMYWLIFCNSRANVVGFNVFVVIAIVEQMLWD